MCPCSCSDRVRVCVHCIHVWHSPFWHGWCADIAQPEQIYGDPLQRLREGRPTSSPGGSRRSVEGPTAAQTAAHMRTLFHFRAEGTLPLDTMGQRPATAPAKARASSPGGQVARQGSPSPSAAAAQTTSSASLATAATSMLSVPSVAMTKFARAAQAKHHVRDAVCCVRGGHCWPVSLTPWRKRSVRECRN